MGEKELTDEQVLQNFLLDIRCLDELLPWIRKFNLFDVLKISKFEIRHSNVLAWLLDPNENHGLGDTFIKGIFQKVLENDTSNKYDVFGILLSDMYGFIVQREWRNIDILLTSQREKIVLAIENKIGTQEHSNQLKKYRELIEKEYSDFKKLYIYLTPYGEEPSDLENWSIMSYIEIVEILEDLVEHTNLYQDISVMVNNYIEIIRRDIVGNQELIEVCNKIYSKHKRALDLIYENKTDDNSYIEEVVDNVLTRLWDEGRIIYDVVNRYHVFSTKKMEKILPALDVPESSWRSYNIYAYWLDIRKERVRGIFELAGLNVPKKSFKIMQKIIGVLKPNDSRIDSFKEKNVFTTKWYYLSDIRDNDEIERAIRSIVEELLKMENELLNKI